MSRRVQLRRDGYASIDVDNDVQLDGRQQGPIRLTANKIRDCHDEKKKTKITYDCAGRIART